MCIRDRYRDNTEDKRFYATCCIEPALLYVKYLNNGLVKVTDKCCKKTVSYTHLGTADNREKLLQKNFKRIYDEVETVIEQYV